LRPCSRAPTPIKKRKKHQHTYHPAPKCTHPLVPLDRRLQILRAAHAHLCIIVHRKLGTREALPRSLFRKRVRERLVLLERAARATQEPLAECHVRLDLALLAGEAVVLDAEQGVEWERGLGKLVCVPDFVLGGGVVEVGGAFEVLARFEEGAGGGGDVGVKREGGMVTWNSLRRRP
jgi:hypothetical protein